MATGWRVTVAEVRARIGQLVARTTSLRMRVTTVAILVVGLTLAAGSVILVELLRTHLVDASRSSAQTRADSVASLISTTPALDRSSLSSFGDDDDEFIQILDSSGHVIAASKNIAHQPAVRTSEVHDVITVASGSTRFVVADKHVTTPQGARTVVTGSSLETAQDTTDSLTQLLLVGFPLTMLIVGTIAWFAVGRTLAPVERIRREVDEISGTQLHRRLPKPPRHDEIGRLTHTMNRMLARLDHAQQRQRRFVSDAAHELRSPVAAIRQNLEVATTYPEHLSTEELLETVRSESNRLERLVIALLSLARIDERSPMPAAEPVDLDDLVFEEAQRLRHTTALRIDTTGVSAGRVAGDKALFSQALRNLVDNAERHARATITFALAEHDATVTLSVDDDGSGIPVEDRHRVFERFVRLDEARSRDDGGSGLGLAIVHDIIVGYAGTVVVTTSGLGGARLVVNLPRLNDAV